MSEGLANKTKASAPQTQQVQQTDPPVIPMSTPLQIRSQMRQHPAGGMQQIKLKIDIQNTAIEQANRS
ncbi:MAG: hypothetical protein CMN92_01230 [Synechococcus sp. CPC100]|nr:hypothetical protein [Synechococcus sp. CPC100]